MEQKTLIQDFTKGNITKQLYLFALPLFLSSLLQVVYNMVDMIIVGHELGKVGLSAVSVGGDVSNFLTFIAMGLSLEEIQNLLKLTGFAPLYPKSKRDSIIIFGINSSLSVCEINNSLYEQGEKVFE